MIGWLKDIFTGITEGFEALISGVMTLVESLGAMLAWIPQLLAFGGGNFMKFAPYAFAPVIAIVLVVFVVKIVLGADNK